MEEKKKFVKLKFKPTGLTFEVEQKNADELLKNEPENFEAVDGYEPEPEKVEQPIYDSIVVEKEEETIPKRTRRNRD